MEEVPRFIQFCNSGIALANEGHVDISSLIELDFLVVNESVVRKKGVEDKFFPRGRSGRGCSNAGGEIRLGNLISGLGRRVVVSRRRRVVPRRGLNIWCAGDCSA